MFQSIRVSVVATLGGPSVIVAGQHVFVVRQPTPCATLDLARAALDAAGQLSESAPAEREAEPARVAV
jgi:hypothetical protein